MNSKCPVCFRPLPFSDGPGVKLITAAGKPLVRVHENCAPVVHSAVNTVGHSAIFLGRRLLARKWPRVSRFVEDYARLRRLEQEKILHG